MIENKICTKCKIKKPISDFMNNVAKAGGKDYFCRDCRNEYNRYYYYLHLEENRNRAKKYALENKERISDRNHLKYIKNKNEIDARNKEYSQTEKGRLASSKSQKKYRELHPDKAKESTRKYHLLNREKHAEYARSYRKTPIGKILDARHRHRRKTLYKKTECTLTLKQWNKILKMQNHSCANCGIKFSDKIKPTKDHIIPLTLGGGLTFGNIRALCVSCNSRKGNRIDFGLVLSQPLVDI